MLRQSKLGLLPMELTQKEGRSPITVAIVDDEYYVIENLTDYFSSVEDIEVTIRTTNPHEALLLIKESPVDVVLSDIHMPLLDGISLLGEIQTLDTPPAFVAMTGIDTDGSMLDILSRGGAGYIIKSESPQSIIKAVKDSVRGGTSISPQCLSRLVNYIPLASNKGQPQSGRSMHLSETEGKVLTLLCEGKSNSDIAQELKYAESTVKKYVSNLMQYFDVSSRVQLVLKALKIGWR